MLKYMENILYFPYISYLIDIVILSIYGLIVIKSLITILVFTLNATNMDLCIVNQKVNEHNITF